MGRLDNKVAVITDAASGSVGTAIRFAVEGASVVICGPQRRRRSFPVRECRELGGTTIFQKTDVAAESDKRPHYRRIRNDMNLDVEA